MTRCLLVAGLVGVLLMGSGSAWAESETQMRILLGVVPGIEEIEFDGFGGSVTVDLDDQSGGNLDVQLVLRTNIERPTGFVGAVGFFLRTHQGEDDFGDEAELTVFGIHGSPGLGVNFSEQVSLEFKADFGLGVANQEIDGFSDGTGGYASFGLAVGPSIKLGENLLLVGEVGYLTFVSSGEADFGFTTVDTEFKGSGLMANLGLGFAF